MKKIFVLMPIICAGCSFLSSGQDGQLFVENLEKSQDPTSVIETYLDIKDGCKDYYANRDIVMIGNALKREYKNQCIKQKATAEPGVNFDCLTSPDVFSSDECILHRRNLHDTSVAFFDYKRFLPANSLIKTDDDFVRLIHFYQKFYTRCDKFVDITNAERQECKETVKQRIQDAVTKNEPCEKVMSENYTAFLSEYCDLFKHKQNYMKELKEDMDKYGKENFCSAANWETELKKLNCKK